MTCRWHKLESSDFLYYKLWISIYSYFININTTMCAVGSNDRTNSIFTCAVSVQYIVYIFINIQSNKEHKIITWMIYLSSFEWYIYHHSSWLLAQTWNDKLDLSIWWSIRNDEILQLEHNDVASIWVIQKLN